MSSISHEQIELELDLRLRELLLEAWSADCSTDGEVAAFLRLAYACGYQDALREGRRGQLFRDLGMPVPRRARA